MNTRLFETHVIRQEIPMTPLWDFHTLDGEGNKKEAYKMLVPSCWESNPVLSAYKGQGLYTKKVTFGGNARLMFKGVGHTAYVYVDGQEVAYHYNAYTEFSVDLVDMPYGDHVIEVKADNTFHEDSALHVPNDYYSYGGITRPVLLEQVGDAYIHYIQFTPYLEGNVWHGKVQVAVKNVSAIEQGLSLTINLGEDHMVHMQSRSVASGQEVVFEGSYAFEGVATYTLEEPTLYEISAQLIQDGSVMDDLIDRVGFRQVSVVGKDILFNDQKVIIKGVNRHEDYAEFGSAIPIEAMYRDIEIIKSMGANCVRTCHYPNDERFLDLCDENGILVWEEAHARGLNEDQMRHKNFDQQSEDCIREMITYHYNHPSIYVWGILNECVSNTEFGKSCYTKQFAQIKSLDSSRPVSYASLQAFIGNDLCLDLVDIVSYNIYPKWYENHPVKTFIQGLKDFVASSDGAGKPILISEIGAGGIYGYRSNRLDKWSEDYQDKLLTEQITEVLSDEDLSGVIIWQYADCRVEQEWFGVRPKSQNNKGLVDMYRREKMAYYTISDIFKKY